MSVDTCLTGTHACAPKTDAVRLWRSVRLSPQADWLLWTVKLMVMALVSGLLMTLPLHAATSCGLEKWLTSLNTTANAYVRAIGTQNQMTAARNFHIQMERYSRAQLVSQINEAGLGANKDALESFITARRYLYDLSKDNWVQMITRFGGDIRFEKQSQSMTTFLQKTECDPFAEDFLNDTVGKKSILQRITTAAASLTTPDVPPVDDSAASVLTFDPNNFDDFRAARYNPKTPRTVIPLSPSQNAPVFLGLFTFIISASIWVWMRVGIAQRRAMRYPCNLPIVIFDGSVPIIGELTDLSQLGAKLETGLKVRVRAKLLVTMNTTSRKARVTWTNTHFVGIKFEKALTETEMTDLLEGFADQVMAAKETHGGFETLIDDVYGTAASSLADYLATSHVEPEEASTEDTDFNGITIKNAYAPAFEEESEALDDLVSSSEDTKTEMNADPVSDLDTQAEQSIASEDEPPNTSADIDTTASLPTETLDAPELATEQTDKNDSEVAA